ncbi:capsular polysaccharide synthesis protein [Candidatus Enterococcus mansonii]|uniref:Capsular polysaccharide synthesis protein n=1 Tax=Candidatus Enterococcus mansonii TaxID=1834181 RepID=A0A242CIM1_9ENTE|nr:capsular polysaccharide synthesis protein [Enterococcus sp. 4G2_DIV0659]OTO09750.1 hypothetical protein A5880_000431 [Enterococcus sp. 4G2_DIV0659]
MSFISKLKKLKKNASIFELIQLGSIVYNPFVRRNGKKVKEDKRIINSYNYLKKHYENRVYKEAISQPMPNKSNSIWICWLQGEDNAPLIVQKCIQSIRDHNKEKEIVILTFENINTYLTLPDYIMEKREKGIISDAHFSDIIRLEVLITYGGTWMDATILCTNHLPEWITDSKLFVYRTTYLQNEVVPIVASSWFISASDSNNEILTTTRSMLRDYWKEHNVLINYYLFHLFFTIATQKYPEQWLAVPKKGNTDPHFLQFELNNTYNNQFYEQLKELSPIHKLTYKGLDDESENSFYHTLFRVERT